MDSTVRADACPHRPAGRKFRLGEERVSCAGCTAADRAGGGGCEAWDAGLFGGRGLLGGLPGLLLLAGLTGLTGLV
ncbi:hypothetical protein GCM10010389_37870 [Streptomyces echinoruber]|uniref:Uncharacterized protein n=1 Tax=Streptomyces echinoruber TaxID=68898 RepID=A0A918VFM4_9ACTN|nr:hypothetical protein GCM10010389_37870 [Streptomyces echinoruber]